MKVVCRDAIIGLYSFSAFYILGPNINDHLEEHEVSLSVRV
jgi:hypothetical protein